jgi:hypothetical protein
MDEVQANLSVVDARGWLGDSCFNNVLTWLARFFAFVRCYLTGFPIREGAYVSDNRSGWEQMPKVLTVHSRFIQTLPLAPLYLRLNR